MGENNVWAIGLDIGSVSLKVTLLDSDGKVYRQESAAVNGLPRDNVSQFVNDILAKLTGKVAVGVTGSGKGLFDFGDEALFENDLVAMVRAVCRTYPDARGILEIGGHQSKWITLGEGRELESFSLNDQCAAGSGAFLEQQAGRLNLNIEEFALMASGGLRGVPIAGRCAVFAKSDMIHQQQKGSPPSEIAYGLCLALARNFRATLMRGQAPVSPSVFLGGGALNRGLYRAFLEVFGLSKEELFVASGPRFFASKGVAEAARDMGVYIPIDRLRLQLDNGGPDSAFHIKDKNSASGLQPLHRPKTTTVPEPVITKDGFIEAFLGIDVGSVSTDFCLLAPNGKVLDGIYLKTGGNPLKVLKEGLTILDERLGDRLKVLGFGTTGSGRHLAGKLLGADVIKNEITCQLLGARHILPHVDTIFEIGGQDSKYVSVDDGRITEFTMNKICAAGTGSFLEEQSESLSIAIKGEFQDIALTSTTPVDLGSQCTVFMDTEVVNAKQCGVPLSDILAGLSYSVAKNYIERVVAGRHIGKHVVFQGGVASNLAVVAAFEKILDHSITVHPYNRISGAIGAAIAVKNDKPEGESLFRGLHCVDNIQCKIFECKGCANLCQVSCISINGFKTYFGDVCERYTEKVEQNSVTSVVQQRETKLPDLAAEVVHILKSFAGGVAQRGTAAIPLTSMMYDLLPFWAVFLKHLGFKVVTSGAGSARILDEGIRRLSAEVCLPIKLAHGHAADLLSEPDVDFVFMPSIVDIQDCADVKSQLCPFEESIGFMVSAFAAHRLIVPTICLTSSRQKIVRELKEKLSAYEFSDEALSSALDAAYDAQEEYAARLEERGREVLSRDFGLAFALLGKPYNVLDPFENLNLAKYIRNLGILPIPMQMLPAAALDLKNMGLTIPWRYNRGIYYALPAMMQDTRIFPVIISNFGCGPDAFAMKHLEGMIGNSPYLFLEFDEHRGEAGLITRLEAFIDEVSHFVDHRNSRAMKLDKKPQMRSHRLHGRRIVMPHFADHAWAHAGAFRFSGYETVVLPAPDEETLSYGEEVSSGKECHPYMLIAGDLMKHLNKGTIREGDVYLFQGTKKACLLHEYASGMRLALQKRGVKGISVLAPTADDYLDILGMPGILRLGRGLLLYDLFTKLKCQMRPYADDPILVDTLFDEILPEISDALAEDRLAEALRQFSKKVETVPITKGRTRPVVGIAGDIYTRIHSFGNRDLFRKLENLGLEVWPASFMVDVVDFGWSRLMRNNINDGKYIEAGSAALLRFKKEVESYRVKFMLGHKVDRADEPSYQEVLRLAAPYVDKNANEIVILNIAKMVDFASRGAHGIINAISFHCMLGTVSASIAEKVRRDHNMIPLTTIVYTGKDNPQTDTRLEAFAHQVKAYASKETITDKKPLFAGLNME